MPILLAGMGTLHPHYVHPPHLTDRFFSFIGQYAVNLRTELFLARDLIVAEVGRRGLYMPPETLEWTMDLDIPAAIDLMVCAMAGRLARLQRLPIPRPPTFDELTLKHAIYLSPAWASSNAPAPEGPVAHHPNPLESCRLRLRQV